MPLARPSHRIMTQTVERQVEVREGLRPCFLVARDTPCELITNSPKKGSLWISSDVCGEKEHEHVACRVREW